MKIIKLYDDQRRLKNSEHTLILEPPKHKITDALLGVQNSLKEIDQKLAKFNEAQLRSVVKKEEFASHINLY